jgi:hypothetical protein
MMEGWKPAEDVAVSFRANDMEIHGLYDSYKLLHLVAEKHYYTNKKRSRSHHAACVLLNGKLLLETISINNGSAHAEVRAWVRFLTLGNGWCLQRGKRH